jgi:hypothetical protein
MCYISVNCRLILRQQVHRFEGDRLGGRFLMHDTADERILEVVEHTITLPDAMLFKLKAQALTSLIAFSVQAAVIFGWNDS